MKKVIIALSTTVFLLTLSNCTSPKIAYSLVKKQVRNSNPTTHYLEDKESITVVTVGTGSPLPSERAQSATAVFVNGHFFMFDVGAGVVQKSEEFNLPLPHLDGIFLTHYHSDHIMGIPNIISRSWQLGRSNNLQVYGPKGLDTLMLSVDQFLTIDNHYRLAHHGPGIMDTSIALAVTNEFEIEQDSTRIVFQQDGVTIIAFDVNHEPIEPAVGYSIEYKGKKVVISGDTKKNDLLLKMAQDCDLLIHEVMLMTVQQMIVEANMELGRERNAHIIKDIQDYHTSPSQVANLAENANVKKLVLNHLAPDPDNRMIKKMYLKQMKAYNGPLQLANDGDVFVIK